MKESFEALANQLGITFTEKIVELKKISQTVYERLLGSILLIILDNAENIIDISPALLTSALDTTKTFVLITSRNRNWDAGEEGSIKKMDLDTFQPEESVKYVKGFLGLESEENVIELTEELQHFPLALRQAVVYIEQENKERSKFDECFTVGDYLRLYKEQPDQLHQEGVYEASKSRYDKTVATTWTITLDAIKKKKDGDLAMKVFEIMAYLSADGIKVLEVFESMGIGVKNGIRLLDDYSMINLDKGIANVHRLVQKVTREKQVVREEEILRESLTMLLKMKSTRAYPYNKQFVSVWSYASKYPNLVKEFYCKFQEVHYSSPLHYFARSGDLDSITNILQAGLDNTKILNFLDVYGKTPIAIASQFGNVNIVKKLYHANNDIVWVCCIDNTPLTIAAWHGHTELVKFFMEECKRHITEEELEQATIHAAVCWNFHVMDYLKPGKRTFCGILSILLSESKDNMFYKKNVRYVANVERFLNHLLNHYKPEILKSIQEADESLIHLAVLCDAYDSVTSLLKIGVHLDKNSSVLHYASYQGNAELVRLFLEKGVDPHATNSVGCAALHFAAAGGQLNTIKILLEYIQQNSQDDSTVEAALNAKDVFGAPPLLYALLSENEETVNFFLGDNQVPIVVNVNTNFLDLNLTLLHIAILYIDGEIIKRLVVGKEVRVDRMALELAEICERTSLKEFLENVYKPVDDDTPESYSVPDLVRSQYGREVLRREILY